MESVLKFPALFGRINQLLHGIDLLVARRNLQQGVRLQPNRITGGTDLDIGRLNVVPWAAAPLAQVVKIPATKTGNRSPLGASVVQIKMAGLLFVGCGIPSLNPAMNALGAHLGLKGSEAHDSANGIAAVHHACGPKDHLGALQGKGVKVDDVLHVACPKNGGVHAHSVDRINQAIRCKPSNHWAPTALLAFLNEDLARQGQDVCRRLGLKLCNLLGQDHSYLRGNVLGGLLPARGRNHHFAQVEGV